MGQRTLQRRGGALGIGIEFPAVDLWSLCRPPPSCGRRPCAPGFPRRCATAWPGTSPLACSATLHSGPLRSGGRRAGSGRCQTAARCGGSPAPRRCCQRCAPAAPSRSSPARRPRRSRISANRCRSSARSGLPAIGRLPGARPQGGPRRSPARAIRQRRTSDWSGRVGEVLQHQVRDGHLRVEVLLFGQLLLAWLRPYTPGSAPQGGWRSAISCLPLELVNACASPRSRRNTVNRGRRPAVDFGRLRRT